MPVPRTFGGTGLIKSTGTLLYSMSSLSGWTVDVGSAAVNTVDTNGTASVKLTTGSGTSAYITRYSGTSFTLDANRTISFDMYIEDISKLNAFGFYISTDNVFTNFYVKYPTVAGYYKTGWNRVVLHVSDLGTGGGSPTPTSTFNTIRFRIDATASNVANVSIENIRTGYATAPILLIHFDDGWQSVYDTALPIMGTDIRASVGVNGASVGTGSYMSAANLTTLHDVYGWDMCNHSWSHLDQTTIPTAKQKLEITQNQTYLESLGFTRRGEHKLFFYPYGGHNSATKQNAGELGLIASRTLIEGTIISPIWEPHLLECYTMVNSYALANAQAQVTNAIKRGGTSILLFHQITAGAATSTEWSTTNFTDFINWLRPLVSGGVIRVMTTTEWIQAMQNREPVM